MKTIATLAALVALLASESLAAPTTGMANSNPLADFPALTGLAGRAGFAKVDTDGVYRAYLADGTIVDAARLTAEQVQTYVDARAPLLSESEAEQERNLYAGVDGQAVPDAQLMAPSEDLKPTAEIERMAQDQSSRRDVSPLEERQVSCPALYCVNYESLCSIYGCACNSILCVIY